VETFWCHEFNVRLKHKKPVLFSIHGSFLSQIFKFDLRFARMQSVKEQSLTENPGETELNGTHESL